MKDFERKLLSDGYMLAATYRPGQVVNGIGIGGCVIAGMPIRLYTKNGEDPVYVVIESEQEPKP